MKVASLAIMGLLFFSLFSFINFDRAYADSFAVDSIGFLGNAINLTDHSTFQANGKFWIFYYGYQNKTSVVCSSWYTSSTDGKIWGTGSAVGIGTACANHFISVWDSGNQVFGIVSNVGTAMAPNYNFQSISGNLNPSGTVSWIQNSTKAAGMVVGAQSATMVDSSGNWWVAIQAFSNHTSIDCVEVFKGNGVTWSRVLNESNTALPVGGGLFQLTNGDVVLSLEDLSAHQGVMETSNGGGTWNSPVYTTQVWQGRSTNTQGNTIFLAGLDNADTRVKVVSIADGGGSWSAATTIDGAVAGTKQIPSLGQNGTGLTAYFASNTGPYNTYAVSTTNLSTWGTPVNIGAPNSANGNADSGVVSNGDAWLGATAGLDELFFSTYGNNITIVIPCTFYQLQCWLYPLFFVSTYFIIICGIAAKAGVGQEDLKTLALEALTIGGMLAVIVGLLNVMIPLMLVVIQVVRTIRA